MLNLLRKRKTGEGYPRQFWLLFFGMFINRGSSSMMWPFLTIYMYQVLGVPLSTVTLLLTVRAIFSILSTGIVSPMMDQFGRKIAMIFSLVLSVGVFLGMAFAPSSLLFWGALTAAHGAILPIFNIGVETMVADIIPGERRAPAYALIRSVSNGGIAIGPVLGGMLALISIQFIFFTISAVYVVLAVLVFILIQETNPEDSSEETRRNGGYGPVLRDHAFVIFALAYFVLAMAFSNLFTLIPVYTSENFGLRETQYSLILSVNAAMVVFFQYGVTKISDRYSPYSVITVGAAFYAIGLTSIAAGSILTHFLISAAVATMGELLVMPTASTMVANMAPENMRARYLGVLSLGWPIGSGIGPVIGGFLNDAVAPAAIWYGAGTMAVVGMIGFLLLSRLRSTNHSPALQVT